MNPQRRFDTVIEGPIRPNEDGFWALYDGDEELTYWDEGQAIEVRRNDQWITGSVVWTESGAYGLGLPGGEILPLWPGDHARRRVGGQI
jgi:hypothetical protein